MSEFIRIEHLNKSFNGRQVLKDLTFSIPVGQITAVMAPSGVGKTTLLRILMGLETADSGQIEGLNDVRLSAVFQEDRLCANLSPVSNIRLVTGPSLSREEILDAVWGKDYFGELKIVDVNIRRLRIKIEDNPTKPTYVNTVWGYGYKWGS